MRSKLATYGLAALFIFLIGGFVLVRSNQSLLQKRYLKTRLVVPSIVVPTIQPTVVSAGNWSNEDKMKVYNIAIRAGFLPQFAMCITNYVSQKYDSNNIQFYDAIKYCQVKNATPPLPQVFTCLDPVIGQAAPCVQDIHNPSTCVDVSNGLAFRCQDTFTIPQK